MKKIEENLLSLGYVPEAIFRGTSFTPEYYRCPQSSYFYTLHITLNSTELIPTGLMLDENIKSIKTSIQVKEPKEVFELHEEINSVYDKYYNENIKTKISEPRGDIGGLIIGVRNGLSNFFLTVGGILALIAFALFILGPLFRFIAKKDTSSGPWFFYFMYCFIGGLAFLYIGNKLKDE